VSGLRAANLGLKLLLELAALAALVLWALDVADGIGAVVLAVAAPLVWIALWGLFAAPRAERRLATPARVPFELAMLGVAAAALAAAGSAVLAIVFFAVVLLNTALLHAFGDLEA
jgi:hypothetical protein